MPKMNKIQVTIDVLQDDKGNLFIPVAKGKRSEYDSHRKPHNIPIKQSPTTGKVSVTARNIFDGFPIHTILTPEQYNHRKLEYLRRYGYISGVVTTHIGKGENRKEITGIIVIPENTEANEFYIHSYVSGEYKKYKKLSELVKEVTDTRYDTLNIFKEWRTENTLKMILQHNETELLARLFEDGIIVMKTE